MTRTSGKKSVPRVLTEAQRRLQSAAEELGDETRKLRALAEQELRGIVGEARVSGRQRFAKLGRELVKLGHRLEKVGAPTRKMARPRRKAVAPRTARRTGTHAAPAHPA